MHRYILLLTVCLSVAVQAAEPNRTEPVPRRCDLCGYGRANDMVGQLTGEWNRLGRYDQYLPGSWSRGAE